jgi:hypothetical protein
MCEVYRLAPQNATHNAAVRFILSHLPQQPTLTFAYQSRLAMGVLGGL